jgi:hypothetical protein
MFKTPNQHKSYQPADPYAEAFSTYKVIQALREALMVMSSLLDFIFLDLCRY